MSAASVPVVETASSSRDPYCCLCRVFMGVQVALTRMLKVDLGILALSGFRGHRSGLLSVFSWTDLLPAFLLVSKGSDSVLSIGYRETYIGPYSTGIGLIFVLVGSVGCFVGAIFMGNEGARSVISGARRRHLWRWGLMDADGLMLQREPDLTLKPPKVRLRKG